MTCEQCKQQFTGKLDNLPSGWRDSIIDFVCNYISSQQTVDCEVLKECLEDTTTSLSEWDINGSEVCITFTDREGVSVTRCFNFNEIINRSLDDLDPKCLAEQTDWIAMTYTEKWQALIDRVCDTCQDAPTTETTTETTT